MIFKDRRIQSSDVTPRRVFEQRREWLKTAAMGSMAMGLGSWLEREAFAKIPIAKEKLAAKFNEQYSTKETATSYEEVTSYNNFYEFGMDKDEPAKYA
ncbi:MAG: protein-methionine-sulfoxide reductase catalytic subunit MsrP, partial [Burkholderiaceae bacterium]|nr:protein-methionine-sulfoxide reductase catalytic subunit MsrP [Burkholderiaceae bacterium]